MLLRGRHYRTGEQLDVHLESGRIASVRPAEQEAADCEGELLAPALVDLQINGALGVSFSSGQLSVDEVCQVAQTLRRHGVGVFLPTVITSDEATLCHAFRTLNQAREADAGVSAMVPGYHLEGPFISPEDGPRGAHPAVYVRPADIEEFKRVRDAAEGRILLMTLAPEIPGALRMIEWLVAAGVRVAIGHSAATPAQIREAVQAGATLSTHLGNGCARMIPRHENLLWEQLATDDLTASMIPDGHHLPWTLVQCILRCKGPGRVIVTCDASPLAGLPAGKFEPWGGEVEVLPEGKIVLVRQGVLAGSWDFTNRVVEKLLRHCDGLPLAEVHDLACRRPAEFLGLSPAYSPRVEIGAPARLVMYGRDTAGSWRLTHSIIDGQVHEIPATALPGGAGAR
jgi:N-acetylglucosamine-6-phosphate deacetylase